MTKLIHEKLSYELRGVLFEVHNQLGRFAREKQYGDFESKLKAKSIPYKREMKLGDSGNTPDFLIADKIVLELKSKPLLLKADYFQTKRYLQEANLELGILVNFRSKYLQPKRVLHKIYP